MSKRRSAPHLCDELRGVYEVERLDVVVHEERPDWHDPKEWSMMGVAKFKYSRKDGKRKLYWMRRDLKWHLYDLEMSRGTKRLEILVKEVDRDPFGAFFG